MTPLYVLNALAEVQASGQINMLDRRGVAALVNSQRAFEWLEKCSTSQYVQALQDMDAANSDDFWPHEEDAE